MNLLRAARASVAMLAALTVCACSQPGPLGQSGSAPLASEPSSSVSRIQVVNDSAVELADLHLLFPQDDVAVGDVAAGAASAYVEVPHGVYNHSAFRFLRDGESVVQPVIDFVGESPLPIDDYTYVLGVDPDSSDRLVLLTLMRAGPVVAETPGSGVIWVRVSNRGPDDLAGFSMRFADDQEVYLGSVPAGATTQYTRLYAETLHPLEAVELTADGKTVSQREPLSGQAEQPSGRSETAGVYTFVVGYDRSAPPGLQVEQVDVVAEDEP